MLRARSRLWTPLNIDVNSTAAIRQQSLPPFWVTVNSGVYTGSMDDKAVQKPSFPPQPAVKTSFNEKDRSICATYSPQPWDFDHTGAIPIWKFLQLTSLQWMDMHRHWFSPPKGGPPFADLFFGRCLLLEFSCSFHDQVFPGCSLPYSMRICKIGKTSMVFKQQILDTSGKQVIAEDYKHCVSASSKTRRSEPWAAWLAQRYPDLCDAPPVATVEPFGPIAVEPSFVYTVKVAPSDTELYRHVGNYQYVRYCCDCVSFGADKGTYSIITGDMAQYKIKRVETLHKGEARAGDVLTVSSWEDPEHPDLIKFQIRKGEYNIAQCTLHFFTSNSKM